MKNTNLNKFMMLLTLAVGSSLQLEAKHDKEYTNCSFSDDRLFHNELDMIQRNLNDANDARKTTSEIKLNMEFDRIQSRINGLNKMICDSTMRKHHISHLENKLAHIRRKAEHYYSTEKNDNESMNMDKSFDDDALFHDELDMIQKSLNEANDARKTTCEDELNMEFDRIASQIKSLNKMAYDSTMRKHHIRHLENKLAHIQRKAKHYYSELSNNSDVLIQNVQTHHEKK